MIIQAGKGIRKRKQSQKESESSTEKLKETATGRFFGNQIRYNLRDHDRDFFWNNIETATKQQWEQQRKQQQRLLLETEESMAGMVSSTAVETLATRKESSKESSTQAAKPSSTASVSNHGSGNAVIWFLQFQFVGNPYVCETSL